MSPVACPSGRRAVRLGLAASWTSIVAVELIAATSGLGYVIMQAGDDLDTCQAAGIIGAGPR
jgi:taurine transport system permease protein